VSLPGQEGTVRPQPVPHTLSDAGDMTMKDVAGTFRSADAIGVCPALSFETWNCIISIACLTGFVSIQPAVGVRDVLHTPAFWLMHCVRSAIPQTNPLARCEFATLRERLIKIGARVIEHIARIRVQLPTSCPEGALFRAVALGLMPSGP
jgi:Transposase DDE domain group 1